MGLDDDADCVEHLWRVAGVEFRTDGSWTEYRCDRCPGSMYVAPEGEHPATT